MKPYTFAELTLPKTYAQDRVLATLARKLASATFEAEAKGRMALGEWKAHLLAGGRPDLVEAELQARFRLEAQVLAQGRAVRNLRLPAGYSSTLEGPLVFIFGPYSDALTTRLKPLGGHWVGARKAWSVPIAQGQALADAIRDWAPEGA